MSASTPNAELLTLRQAIDGLDDALIGLLVCRLRLSHQAQALKAKAGLPPLDAAREAHILERYEHRWPGASGVAVTVLDFCRAD